MLVIEEGEVDSIIFNCLSGETHQLNPTAMCAFECLQSKSATLAELVKHLSSILEIGNNCDLETHIRRLLLEFDELGLIYSVRD